MTFTMGQRIDMQRQKILVLLQPFKLAPSPSSCRRLHIGSIRHPRTGSCGRALPLVAGARFIQGRTSKQLRSSSEIGWGPQTLSSDRARHPAFGGDAATESGARIGGDPAATTKHPAPCTDLQVAAQKKLIALALVERAERDQAERARDLGVE